jgi:hypothetical protein
MANDAGGMPDYLPTAPVHAAHAPTIAPLPAGAAEERPAPIAASGGLDEFGLPMP